MNRGISKLRVEAGFGVWRQGAKQSEFRYLLSESTLKSLEEWECRKRQESAKARNARPKNNGT